MAWAIVFILSVLLAAYVVIKHDETEGLNAQLKAVRLDLATEKSLSSACLSQHKRLQDNRDELATRAQHQADKIAELVVALETETHDRKVAESDLTVAQSDRDHWKQLHADAEVEATSLKSSLDNAKAALLANVAKPARKRTPWPKAIEDAFNG